MKGRRYREAFRGLLVIACTIGLLTCGPKARIQGEVFDGFGQPLAGAQVVIPGTQFAATTDDRGRYTLPFAPGHFQVKLSREGYTSTRLDFDLTMETTLPAERVTLTKVPSDHGVYAFGKTDYIKLAQGKLIFDSTEHGFSWNGALYSESYRVSGIFTQLPTEQAVIFLDTEPASLILLEVDPDGVILRRQKAWLSTKDEGTAMREKSSERLAPGVLRRTVELPQGRFAFVHVSQSAQLHLDENGGPSFGAFEGHPVREPIYLFQIGSSQAAGQTPPQTSRDVPGGR